MGTGVPVLFLTGENRQGPLPPRRALPRRSLGGGLQPQAKPWGAPGTFRSHWGSSHRNALSRPIHGPEAWVSRSSGKHEQMQTTKEMKTGLAWAPRVARTSGHPLGCGTQGPTTGRSELKPSVHLMFVPHVHHARFQPWGRSGNDGEGPAFTGRPLCKASTGEGDGDQDRSPSAHSAPCCVALGTRTGEKLRRAGQEGGVPGSEK